MDTLSQCSASEISLVTGYEASRLAGWGNRHFHNDRFATTNMVESLFAAEVLLDGSEDLIVCYSDIVYERRVLEALLNAPGPIATVIDRNWLSLWASRMEDPLADAETLRLNPDGTLREIGRKPRDFTEIEGQYVGLTKICAGAQSDVLAHYHGLARDALYDGRSFEQMYMTRFLTSLIDAGFPIHVAATDSGWLEVDTVDDLARYESMHARGELGQFWKPAEAVRHPDHGST